MKKGKFGKEDGSMLVMAVVFSFVTILLGMAFLTTVARMEDIVNQDVVDVKASYNGNAAVMAAVMAERHGDVPQDGHYFGYYDDNGFDDNGYSYRIIPGGQQDAAYGYSSYTRIIGTGKSSYIDVNSSKDIEAELMLEGAANFLYLTDKERDVKDSIIYFYTPDTLDGPVHSNDTIHIEVQGGQDYPRFMERVTTHRPTRSPTFVAPPSNHARFDKGGRAYYGRVWKFPDQADEVRRFNGIVGPDGQYLGSTDPATMTQIALSHDSIFVRSCHMDPDSFPDTVWQCSPSQISSGDIYKIPATGCMFILGKVILSAGKRYGLHRRPARDPAPPPQEGRPRPAGPCP